jgi:hypothetical protein
MRPERHRGVRCICFVRLHRAPRHHGASINEPDHEPCWRVREKNEKQNPSGNKEAHVQNGSTKAGTELAMVNQRHDKMNERDKVEEKTPSNNPIVNFQRLPKPANGLIGPMAK